MRRAYHGVDAESPGGYPAGMDPIYIALGALGGAAGLWLATKSGATPAAQPTAAPVAPGQVIMLGPTPALIMQVQLPFPRNSPVIQPQDVLPRLSGELTDLNRALGVPCVSSATDAASLDTCLEVLVHALRGSGRLPSDRQGHIPAGDELRRRLREQTGDLLVDLYVLRNYVQTRQPGWLGFLRGDW